MNYIGTIARKELRGYFRSAIALVFLATFLAITLFTFFWVEKFFARGIADLRPLFEPLPWLLIFLVSALSMRLWSEEKRAGTIEILLTLPVPRWQLVVGKFLAGMALVAIALALTIGLPLTVARMGNLDWGPVFGGYLAALLLAAAYLAMGMCISAATETQIIALIMTLAVGALMYLPGMPAFVGLFSGSTAEVMRALGTGSRFASIARGVLDLRDLAYYLALTVGFLALNIYMLSQQTLGVSRQAVARRGHMQLALGLALANAVALNLWLAPVSRSRVDLTSSGTYSLSEVTDKLVLGLEEPLLIRGYFSAKTHPQLAPLIPQLRDVLDEYMAIGGRNLRVEFVDPTNNEELQKEAKERFNLEPTPLKFASKSENSIVNAYFAIAMAYGDQQTTIPLDKLIKVRALDIGDVEISLDNVEYEVTGAMKKLVSGFQRVESLFATMPGKLEVTAYLTPSSLPPNWKDGAATLTKVMEGLKQEAGNKLTFTQVEPKTEAEMKQLMKETGIRPYADLFSGQVYYFHIMAKLGKRAVLLMPPKELTEASLKTSLLDGLKRVTPGFTRVVGMWTPPAPPQQPQQMRGMPQQPSRPPQTFQTLEQSLRANYEVRNVDLAQPVPDDVDVLVLAGPANLDQTAAQNVDQFVMRGGNLVALAGRYRLSPNMMGGLAVEKVTTGLETVFTKWGIALEDKMLLDERNASFPVPVMTDYGTRELRDVAYPYFAKVEGDDVKGGVITAGVPATVVHWGSPLTADAKVGEDERKVDTVLASSELAWTSDDINVAPNFRSNPKTGFAAPPEKRERKPLALSVMGGFASAFASDKPADAKPAGDGKEAKPLLQHSPPQTRMVVFGSSAFASDDIVSLAQQLGSELAMTNIQLVQNAIDFALADTELLQIRAHSAASHALTVPEASRRTWEFANYGIALMLLAGVIGFSWLRRNAVRPIQLTKAKGAN